MTIIGNENILWFELSIDDTIIMENLHTINYLSAKLSNNFLSKYDLFLFQIKVYITFVQILHNYVNFILVLEGLADAYQNVFVTYLFNHFTL